MVLSKGSWRWAWGLQMNFLRPLIIWSQAADQQHNSLPHIEWGGWLSGVGLYGRFRHNWVA